ncbi:hypothetical protein [Desulfoluna spongiiphila]|uniref:hypothetical protein n=1 Tax=Desulfoluna spongiiphila TaxID=419481 RepID=UPI0012584F54|nr:hypothetical protein [Desulfoluna spongiiphila]VVS91041.1 consensus disorder prediction [Desulfoluna spongiiphila]
MTQIKLISINSLLLDQNNPRFVTPAENQRDAIEQMFSLKTSKVLRIAKDIAINGLDPSENMMVHKNGDPQGGYIVDEGNRRLTALKVLNKPELAPTKDLQTSFSKIRSSADQIPKKINCAIFDDDSYEHWVSLKHTGQNNGVGRVSWDSPEISRYNAFHGKPSLQNQLYSFIDLFPDEFSQFIENKKVIRITNLSRLVGDPDVRKAFGLKAIDGKLFCNQPLDRFISEYSKLLRVMTELQDNGRAVFTVDIIKKKTDRECLIQDLDITPPDNTVEMWPLLRPLKIKQEVEQTNKKNAIEANSSNDSNRKNKQDINNAQQSGNNTNSTKGITKPPKIGRNNLIPSSVQLNFRDNKRCSRIFMELKRSLKFENTPNAISVMLRVFIELSLTSYIERESLKFRPKKQGQTPGLHDKVVMCAEQIKSLGNITQAQCTSVCTFSKQITKASGSLHQYVHNPHFIPTKEMVNTEWDNFQALLEAIWRPE